MRSAAKRAIAHQNKTCVVGNLSPFVKVEGQRIGLLNAAQLRGADLEPASPARRRRHRRETRVFHAGYQFGERGKIIDCAGIDGSRRSDH